MDFDNSVTFYRVVVVVYCGQLPVMRARAMWKLWESRIFRNVSWDLNRMDFTGKCTRM